jgi:cytochrome c oxidase cbb3-type subunit IV
MSDAYGWVLSLWQLWLFILFVAIVAWVFWPKNKRRLERQGEIPLRDDDRDR